jgi:hypothetical protein
MCLSEEINKLSVNAKEQTNQVHLHKQMAIGTQRLLSRFFDSASHMLFCSAINTTRKIVSHP